MLSSGSTFSSVVNSLISVMDGLVALIAGLVVIIFMWRIVAAWFIHGGDPKEIEKGRQSALVGILVLVVIFGLWAIVSIIRTTFFG